MAKTNKIPSVAEQIKMQNAINAQIAQKEKDKEIDAMAAVLKQRMEATENKEAKNK